MKNLRNRATICLLLFILFWCTADLSEAETKNSKIKISSISKELAKKLIDDQISKTKLKNLNDDTLKPDDNQNFQIHYQTKNYYLISSIRYLPPDSTCSVLLFDDSKNIVDAIDVLGPKDDKRFWMCTYIEAISFSDYYPDGSLKIIALYLATPPSSEHFTLPIVLKMDLNKPSLTIDEELTSKFEDSDIKTIKEARSLLNKQKDK
ncbi:MAG: hypothetical protein M0036_15580 [Desulfobacteraceae bacterium]|nr:hypothetical protein [Desulfobacteraceae bacterium]